MEDELFMQRCIDLAANAKGYTSPNPVVGSVVVYKSRIIGEGWHHKPGMPHAEVNAIASVEQQELLPHSTLYVSLEPCAHFGKTPPCADLIIEKNIPRVVIGCRDPFDAVNGKGIEKLRNAGIEVISGIMEEECQKLNAPFFTYHLKKRPYIILKWAQSRDGYIDKKRKSHEKGINWITGEPSKILVHRWRHEADAIMVGTNTVINDNPSLTVRKVKGKDPIRIILDRNHRIPAQAAVFRDGNFLLFTTADTKSAGGGNRFEINFDTDPLPQILKVCYEKNIQSILVEGGASLLHSFIASNLWDEARIFTGTSNFDEGIRAPLLNKKPTHYFKYGHDDLNIHYS